MASASRWRLLGQGSVIVVSIVVFFTVYNRLVVDVNLRNLKLSLKVMGGAGAVGKAEAAMTLIDQNLLAAVALPDKEAADLTGLQYAKGVLSSNPDRMVEDAQTIVSTMVAKQTAARGGILGTLDAFNDGIQASLQQLTVMPRRLLPGAKLSDAIDLTRLNQAAQHERSGQWAKAEALYQQLLREFPTYKGRGGLKMRLGYLYQRQRRFPEAERLYQEVARETRDPAELGVAQQSVEQLRQLQRASQQVAVQQRHLATITQPAQRQQAAYDLGVKQMQVFDMEAAIQSFQTAEAAAKGTPLAAQAKFRRAWCLKSLGRYEEAILLFDEVAKLVPSTKITAVAMAQIADAYRATGQYEAAAGALEAAARASQDQAFSAMLTAQVGSVYLLDLNQPEKAEIYFRQVEQSFPASTVSAMKQTIQEFQAEKTATHAKGSHAEVGLPVLGWLEKTTPTFVEVFEERLAEYIRHVGEHQLSRRLTEQEFLRIVVKRVQERYAGQISDPHVSITPEGFEGSIVVHLGLLTFPVEGKVNILLVKERPHVEILRLAVGRVPVPGMLRQLLQSRVNDVVDRAKMPLRVMEFHQLSGAVDVRVLLAEEAR